jgi:hypothetical protein
MTSSELRCWDVLARWLQNQDKCVEAEERFDEENSVSVWSFDNHLMIIWWSHDNHMIISSSFFDIVHLMMLACLILLSSYCLSFHIMI